MSDLTIHWERPEFQGIPGTLETPMSWPTELNHLPLKLKQNRFPIVPGYYHNKRIDWFDLEEMDYWTRYEILKVDLKQGNVTSKTPGVTRKKLRRAEAAIAKRKKKDLRQMYSGLNEKE